MIYVLVRSSGSYDDKNTELVFASKSKSACEEKHAAFLVKDAHYSVVAQTLNKEIEYLTKDFVRTPEPKYSELAPKPLVWMDYKWHNPYSLEYNDLIKKEDKIYQDLRWQAILNVHNFYRDYGHEVADIEKSLAYTYAKFSYYIEEVESD